MKLWKPIVAGETSKKVRVGRGKRNTREDTRDRTRTREGTRERTVEDTRERTSTREDTRDRTREHTRAKERTTTPGTPFPKPTEPLRSISAGKPSGQWPPYFFRGWGPAFQAAAPTASAAAASASADVREKDAQKGTEGPDPSDPPEESRLAGPGGEQSSSAAERVGGMGKGPGTRTT